VEACRGWSYLGLGVGNSERCEPLLVGDQKRDQGEAGFHREDPCGRCREAVCSPSLDLEPEGVEAGVTILLLGS